MSKGRKHFTTKNTMAKPPVTRLAVIEGDCNGYFKIVTDLTGNGEFDKIYRQWFDDPTTRIWNIESFIMYFKQKFPKRICITDDQYQNITKDKVIPATKEEWLEENN